MPKNTGSEQLADKRGLIATVVTSGEVKPQFAIAMSNMRDWNSRNGFVNIEYRIFDAKLVESGRDAVCRHALESKYEWLMMIDADACSFAPDSTAKMLHNAFISTPQSHVIGAYAQLKQPPYLPTIDTGTGTWEIHYPGQGMIPVIRTGGHFLFIKTAILTFMGPPWFRTRIPLTPAKAMKELDNFARITLDGKNPLQEHPEWDTLLKQAVKASTGVKPMEASIGEDSGFCDNVRACGGSIYVDTNCLTGHVATKILSPTDLREEVKKQDKRFYAAIGVRDYE